MNDRLPVLTAEEELDLLKRAQAGDRAARDALVMHNQRLVWQMALYYYNSITGRDQTQEDLVQRGNIGLLKAIARINLALGYRFSTYAKWWIRAEIYDEVCRYETPLAFSSRDRNKIAKIRSFSRRFYRTHERNPTPEEVETGLGIDAVFAAGVIEGVLSRLPVTLDSSQPCQEIPGQDRRAERSAVSLHEVIPDPAASNLVENLAAIQELEQAAARLSEIEQDVIRRRYLYDPADSYTSISRAHGLPRAQIKQIESEALAKLREWLSD